MSRKQVRITAEPFSAAAQRIPLRWEPVMRDEMQNPEAADFVNRRLQPVFPLADPRSTPPLDTEGSAEDREAFTRYIAHAHRLAATQLLTSYDQITVFQEDANSEEVITEEFSPDDVTTGFMTMFRQFYSPDEAASFRRVHGALMRVAKGSEPHDQILREWGKAQGRLRTYPLEHLVLVALAEAGHIPKNAAERDNNPAHPDHRKSPQELFSIHWYGDMIHWGDKRDLLLRSEHDRFLAASERMEFLEGATDLAHIYIGFSAVVAAAARTPS